MPIEAVLTLDRGGLRYPLAATRDRAVLKALAQAALGDLRRARAELRDETLAALAGQEADRLERCLATVGLGGTGGTAGGPTRGAGDVPVS
jgi:hypothetical protein